jgi:hypothetical protein
MANALPLSLPQHPLNERRLGFRVRLTIKLEFLSQSSLQRRILTRAPIERLAVLRLDGDMYSSTIDALTALYDKVSPGGFVIIDDYSLPTCREAVHDFRRDRGIEDLIVAIDAIGSYWRRAA